MAETEYLAEQQNLVARIEAAQAELDRLEQGAQLAEADKAASAYRPIGTSAQSLAPRAGRFASRY